MIRLFKAIRTCHRLRNTPIEGVTRSGDYWIFTDRVNSVQAQYNNARLVIRQHPWLERLIKRWI